MNIILFDGICNLCNQLVLFLIKHDKDNYFHFAALESTTIIEIAKSRYYLFGKKELCQVPSKNIVNEFLV